MTFTVDYIPYHFDNLINNKAKENHFACRVVFNWWLAPCRLDLSAFQTMHSNCFANVSNWPTINK